MSLFDIFNTEKRKVTKMTDADAQALANELGIKDPSKLKRGELNTAINKAVKEKNAATKAHENPPDGSFSGKLKEEATAAIKGCMRTPAVIAYLLAVEKKDAKEADLIDLAKAAIQSSRTDAGLNVLNKLPKAKD